ncbi:hypothetical protein MIR68_002030 [Amoeboaphelidium protococcarum]|nr:hypothetical protein MIR68_002030 [Amoeboaphelidium protococcarum]
MGNSYNTLQKHYNIHNPDAEAEVEAAQAETEVEAEEAAVESLTTCLKDGEKPLQKQPQHWAINVGHILFFFNPIPSNSYNLILSPGPSNLLSNDVIGILGGV